MSSVTSCWLLTSSLRPPPLQPCYNHCLATVEGECIRVERECIAVERETISHLATPTALTTLLQAVERETISHHLTPFHQDSKVMYSSRKHLSMSYHISCTHLESICGICLCLASSSPLCRACKCLERVLHAVSRATSSKPSATVRHWRRV